MSSSIPNVTPKPNREWKRFRFPESLYPFGGWLLVLAFLAFSNSYLNIQLERLPKMFGRIQEVIVTRYFPPDIAYITDRTYAEYVVETIQMAYLGTLFGVLIALPLCWFGAYNMTPNRRLVYPLARFTTMSARAVHQIIWALIFVAILGFGMLSGVIALTLGCLGFAGKLFAEEIEGINMGPVEAMRATGANELQVMLFGVWPQIRVAFTGICIYTWDVTFRSATVVGFVGAGGMGFYLKRNVMQLETERVAAIILSILVLVLISETLSAYARRKVRAMK